MEIFCSVVALTWKCHKCLMRQYIQVHMKSIVFYFVFGNHFWLTVFLSINTKFCFFLFHVVYYSKVMSECPVLVKICQYLQKKVLEFYMYVCLGMCLYMCMCDLETSLYHFFSLLHLIAHKTNVSEVPDEPYYYFRLSELFPVDTTGKGGILQKFLSIIYQLKLC